MSRKKFLTRGLIFIKVIVEFSTELRPLKEDGFFLSRVTALKRIGESSALLKVSVGSRTRRNKSGESEVIQV